MRMVAFPVPRCALCAEPWPVFAVFNRETMMSVDYCREHAPPPERDHEAWSLLRPSGRESPLPGPAHPTSQRKDNRTP
jgi:hypothetical protein